MYLFKKFDFNSFTLFSWTASLISFFSSAPDVFLNLSFEIGARYTFSDKIDGSLPYNENFNYTFGNENNNDWYMFSGFNLTYTFGRQPCYCNIKWI